MKKMVVMFLLSALVGCSAYRNTRTDLAVSGIEDYNDVQADIQSRLLVKNILRAKDRLPRHFTGLGTAQVAQSTTSRLGPLGFNDDKSALGVNNVLRVPSLFKRTLQFSFDVGSTPRVDMSALDSKEFITGMTSTVRYDVLHYFQRQGWPIHLMELLFTREFQFGTERFINDPGDAEKFNQFLALTESLARAGLELKVASRPPGKDSFVGPSFCASETHNLEAQVLASQQGLRLFETKDARCKDDAGKEILGWGLAKPVTDNYWSFDACKIASEWEDQSRTAPDNGEVPLRARVNSDEFEDVVKAQIALAWRFAHSVDSNTKDGDIDAQLVTWRTERATTHWKKTPSSLRDIRRDSNPFGFYKGVCESLREFQAIKQGQCDFGDTGCEPSAGTTLAQVQLNAVASEERNLRITGKALLRSPESIVYFLGQVVRAQEGGEKPKLPVVTYWNGKDTSYRLMSLQCTDCALDDAGTESNDAHTKTLIKVDHGGKTYVIQEHKDDRSMTVINAVLLLIGLQRSAAELPTTPTVNVVGG